MQPWQLWPFLRPLTRLRGQRMAGLCALLLAGTSQAQTLQDLPPPAPQEDEPVWLAASNHTLDQLRGGFSLGQGLVVSFGVSRAVYINGELVTSTSFQVNDLSQLSAAQAAVLAQQLPSQAQLVQNGPGNTLAPGALMAPFATYIQNTLNDQTIRNQTVIQASTNGLAMVKNLNLQGTLNDALSNAIRQR
ncbi:MAG: hypothetical protein M3R45_17185 [Pseudomonadota bacterium]|nr:hypothetical protein [Pseudomonadota bacterium]